MKKRNKIILISSVGVVVAWVAGNAAWNRYAFPKWLEPLRARYQDAVSHVRIDDGVDSNEAQEIAGLYLGEYISGCGAPEPPVLSDGKWTVPLRIGFTGALSDKVVEIDAKNGAVASNAGPRFSTFREFAEDLIGGIAARRRD